MKALKRLFLAMFPPRHHCDPELDKLRAQMREAKEKLHDAACDHERTVIAFRSDPTVQKFAGDESFGLDGIGGAMTGMGQGMSSIGEDKKAARS